MSATPLIHQKATDLISELKNGEPNPKPFVKTSAIRMLVPLISSLILAGYIGCSRRETLYLYEYEPRRYAIELKDWKYIRIGHDPFNFIPDGIQHYKRWLTVPDTVGRFSRTEIRSMAIIPDSTNTKWKDIPTEGWIELKPGTVQFHFPETAEFGVYDLIIVKGMTKLEEGKYESLF